MSRWKIALMVALMASGDAGAREVVDMMGRRVTVPDTIRRLYAPSPYGAYMMYALAPDLMTGLVFVPRDNEKKFLPKNLLGLPVIGSFGMSPSANPETILQTAPEVLILWKNDRSPVAEPAAATVDKLKIPYVYVTASNLQEYPDAMRFLGKLTGREDRAEKMAKHAERILRDVTAAVTKVPGGARPKVYYAEGVDGLSTECNDSIHVELLRILGDLDVHRCHTASHVGMEKLSLEQVILYNPDVIVAQERVFFDQVFRNPAWSQVKAVRDRKVLLVPRTPLNWFDRPPSFMRFLGLEWLAARLYPKELPLDVSKEVKSFYATFLGADLTDRDVQEILPR